MKIDYEVAVIGGGISGCAISYELGKRNISHCLIESEPELALKASGNPLGILMPTLTAEKTPISEFSHSSFLHTTQLLNEMKGQNFFHSSGVLQLAYQKQKEIRFQKAREAHVFPKEALSFFSAEEIKERFQLETNFSGIYYSEGGWFRPRNFCQQLSKLAVSTFVSTTATQISKDLNSIVIHTPNDFSVRVQRVILANALWSTQLLPQNPFLKFGQIRGQIIRIKAIESLRDVKPVVCFDGYLSPVTDENWQILGGTYDRQNLDEYIRQKDTDELLEKLRKYLPIKNSDPLDVLDAKASIRTTSTDHLPVVGEIEDRIFICSAMGSRGLTYAPYSASLLVSKIFGELKSEHDQKMSYLLRAERFSRSG